MNEPTTIGGVNEALRRRYGVPGQQGPILTLASDLFPTVNMSDEGMPADLAFLAGTRLCVGGEQDAADVGLPSGVQLTNPAGSGIIAVVTNALVSSITAQDGVLVFKADAADTTTAGFLRDSRFTPGARASCTFGTRTEAANVGVARFRMITGNQNIQPLLPWVLSPGTAMFVQGQDVNIGVLASFQWRERAIETWETGQG